MPAWTRSFATVAALVVLALGVVPPPAGIAADGRDHVSGAGIIGPSNFSHQHTFEFEASSEADGSNATGTWAWAEGPYSYAGTVECLNVSGTKAVIGGRITSHPDGWPPGEAQVTVFYVEDHGSEDLFVPTGVGGSTIPGRIVYPDCTLYQYEAFPLLSGHIAVVDEVPPYQPAPAPVGDWVQVQPSDATTGGTPLMVTFESVTSAGTMSLSSSSTGPAVPSGFALGDPPIYYDISTTASFSGLAQVCIHYAEVDYGEGADLRLLHYENGAWTDITDWVDTDRGRICGYTESFSPFAVAARTGPIYTWSGFLQPVDNLPTWNKVKAGSAVPVKFSLGGNQGLAIFATGSPNSRSVSCVTSAPLDAIETTVAAGSSSLSYSAATDQYTYVWKTEKAWAGGCRELTLALADGSVHGARFSLTK